MKAVALSAVMGLSEAKAKNRFEIILQESETVPQETFIRAPKYGVSFIKGTLKVCLFSLWFDFYFILFLIKLVRIINDELC